MQQTLLSLHPVFSSTPAVPPLFLCSQLLFNPLHSICHCANCHIRHRVQIFQSFGYFPNLLPHFLLHPSLTCTLLGFISNQLQPEFLELFLVDNPRTQFIELLLTDHDSAMVSRLPLVTGTDLLASERFKPTTRRRIGKLQPAPLPCKDNRVSQHQ